MPLREGRGAPPGEVTTVGGSGDACLPRSRERAPHLCSDLFCVSASPAVAFFLNKYPIGVLDSVVLLAPALSEKTKIGAHMFASLERAQRKPHRGNATALS